MNRTTTQAEDDAIIAALRLWQSIQSGNLVLNLSNGGPAGLDHFDDISTCMGEHPALSEDEIDVLLIDVYGV